MTTTLQGKIALVTGASRGVGKGIALGLGEAGATVYITGRTVEEGKGAVPLAGTIQQTAQEVTALGGVGIAIRCDHTRDDETRAVFAQIEREQGRLDLLVNNTWGGYEFYRNGTEFWHEQGFWDAPIDRWDKMFAAGVRAHYLCSTLAAPLMIAQRSGLIVNVSFISGQKLGHAARELGVAYGAAKAASDMMARCMAQELEQHQVAVLVLYPGLVRTEGVMAAAQFFDLSNSESPLFQGRVVAALASDPAILSKNGRIFVSAQAALEYGVIDMDGKQPRPEFIAK
jgi:NAD(P)-dependent dehydrogenase (short-subunit alcohol dehydrogenase family)